MYFLSCFTYKKSQQIADFFKTVSLNILFNCSLFYLWIQEQSPIFTFVIHKNITTKVAQNLRKNIIKCFLKNKIVISLEKKLKILGIKTKYKTLFTLKG